MALRSTFRPRRIAPRKLAAWGVHAYTAMGLPLAYLCAMALVNQEPSTFFLLAAIACLVDATDGFLARRVGVKEVLPQFNGRRLDDIVDYLHFVALPMAAVVAFGLLRPEHAWFVVVPLLASGYGFSQEQAKTDDAFVGFPSYWNVVVLYLYVLGAPPRVVLAVLAVLSALVFVPIHYLYPSRAQFLRVWTIGLGVIWTVMIFAVSLAPQSNWGVIVAWISLFYPVYYTVASFVHHARTHARLAAEEAANG